MFVGGLHGLINADALAHIMDDLFGGVVYAGIDTDKYKYPIGKLCCIMLRCANTLYCNALIDTLNHFRLLMKPFSVTGFSTCKHCNRFLRS